MDKKNQIEWTAPEFEYYEKSGSWYIVTGAITGILFLIAIFTKNLLFALMIALTYFILSMYASKRPREISLAITPQGVKVERTLYTYENLRSFWLFYDPPEIRELSLRSKKTVMPYIRIPLGEQDPVEIRQMLIKYLPEKKHQESITDNLARQIRF